MGGHELPLDYVAKGGLPLSLKAIVRHSGGGASYQASRRPAATLGDPGRLLFRLLLLLELLLQALCFLVVVFIELVLLLQVLLMQGHHLLQPLIVLAAARRCLRRVGGW